MCRLPRTLIITYSKPSLGLINGIEVFGENFREFPIRRVVLWNRHEILYSFELFIAVVFIPSRQNVDKPPYADTKHKFGDEIMKKYANLRFTVF